MTQKVVTRRRTWRLRTKVLVLVGMIAVSALLYWEQAALLFGLSTLGLCALLALVAKADLESRDRELHEKANEDPARVEANL